MSISLSKFATLALLLAYAEARFGQEQVPVAAVQALGAAGFGEPGVAETIAGSIPGSLLAAAGPCQKLSIADQIIDELGNDQQVVDAAKGLVSAETNFNPFAVDVPFVCADASLPASAQLRGITPLVDPAVGDSDVANELSATSVQTPFDADGLSQAEVLIAQGFTNFTAVGADGENVVLPGQDGAAAGGDAAGGAAGGDAATGEEDAAGGDTAGDNNAGEDAAGDDAAGDDTGNADNTEQPVGCGVLPPNTRVGNGTVETGNGVGNGTAGGEDANTGNDNNQDENDDSNNDDSNQDDDNDDNQHDNNDDNRDRDDDEDEDDDQNDDSSQNGNAHNGQNDGQDNAQDNGSDGQNNDGAQDDAQGDNGNNGQDNGQGNDGANNDDAADGNAGNGNAGNGNDNGNADNGNGNAGNGNGNAGNDNAADDNAGDAADNGALDFGLCQPTMAFIGGLNGRPADEFTFIPQDPLVAEGQQEALNPNIITNRICDQLTNVCEANDAAKAACEDAQAQIEALGTRDQSTADTWNALLGFAGQDTTQQVV